MHDELCVRVGDGIQHVRKQAQPRRQRQLARRAVAIDRFALDVLEHQVGLPVIVHARIEQARDVRMREPCEQARFVADLVRGVAPESATVEQLDGRAPLELAVAAPREPDAAHAPAPQQPLDGVGTDVAAGE